MKVSIHIPFTLIICSMIYSAISASETSNGPDQGSDTHQEDAIVPDKLLRLVNIAKKGVSTSELTLARPVNGGLDKSDSITAIRFSNTHPNIESYLILVYLSRIDVNSYLLISPNIRSRILIDAVTKLTYLNDFGNYDKVDVCPGESMNLLTACGLKDSKDGLLNLLKDSRRALLMGSEEAEIAYSYDYRRADFACISFCIMNNESINFCQSWSERSKKIDRILLDLEKGKSSSK